MKLTPEQKSRLAAIRIKRPYLTCGDDNCGHSDDQHDAFDLGIADGEVGRHRNPYTDESLRHGWESGHSIASQMPRVSTELFGH